MREVSLSIAEADLTLFADGAVWWAEERTLFVADLHLGREEAFRARGLAIPGSSASGDLRRLLTRAEALGAVEVIVLGDLVHARESLAGALIAELCALVSQSAASIVMVPGNHDEGSHERVAAAGIQVLEQEVRRGPFVLRHEPVETCDGGYLLAGHLHPCVRLRGRGGDHVRLPCFWFRAESAVLPAFGTLAGGLPVAAARGDRIVATTGRELFMLTPQGDGGRSEEKLR